MVSELLTRTRLGNTTLRSAPATENSSG